MSAYQVKFVVTHERPHLDELAAWEALRRHGNELFSGVATATLEIFDPAKHEDGRSEDDWRKDGYLFLGVRGGTFDDHPHEVYPNECVFTQVCDALGLSEDPAWQALQKFVLHEDRHGAQNPMHIASIVKTLHRSRDAAFVRRFVATALFDGFLTSQKSFQEALGIVRSRAKTEVVHHEATGVDLVLCWVDSDNQDISAAARSKDGLQAALVVQRKSGGHVYVSSSRYQGVTNVSPLAAQLRLQEQRYLGVHPVETSETLLGADGSLFNWYHHVDAACLMNGALTAAHVPPTKIHLQRIVELAKTFLARCHLDLSHKRAMQRVRAEQEPAQRVSLGDNATL